MEMSQAKTMKKEHRSASPNSWRREAVAGLTWALRHESTSRAFGISLLFNFISTQLLSSPSWKSKTKFTTMCLFSNKLYLLFKSSLKLTHCGFLHPSMTMSSPLQAALRQHSRTASSVSCWTLNYFAKSYSHYDLSTYTIRFVFSPFSFGKLRTTQRSKSKSVSLYRKMKWVSTYMPSDSGQKVQLKSLVQETQPINTD